MGSWEAIKMDSSLKLGDKILQNSSKLQFKKINARAEYLLKVLKKQIDTKLGVVRKFYFISITSLKNPYTFILFQQGYVLIPQLEYPLKVIPRSPIFLFFRVF